MGLVDCGIAGCDPICHSGWFTLGVELVGLVYWFVVDILVEDSPV